MRKLLAAATVLVVALAVGLWLVLGAGPSSAARSRAATTHAVPAARTHAQPAAGTATAAGQAAAESERATESESESATEAENGSAAEHDTHEDPAGVNVNHECPPNCDTAAGEQP
jgi:hypothetical protein